MNSIGERAGNAALEEVAVALAVRRDYQAGAGYASISFSLSSLLSDTKVQVHSNKAVVGANAFAHKASIPGRYSEEPLTYQVISPGSGRRARA